MSALLQEIYSLLHIKQIRTTPYHPQTDSLVERFNGTLKAMLKKLTSRNKDWNELLPYLLFAYQEVPQESTGFAPFELLYGRRVRGPLDVLKEVCTGEEVENVSVAAHIMQMRERLQEMSSIARKFGQSSEETKEVLQRAGQTTSTGSRRQGFGTGTGTHQVQYAIARVGGAL